MKIIDVEASLVLIPLPQPGHRPAWVSGVMNSYPFTLTKVTTDEGITGFGAQACIGKEVETFINGPFFKHQLLNVVIDTSAIEKVSNLLRIGAFFGTRANSVEIALWDLIGKSTGQPIYKLLGGFRDEIKAYLSTAEVKSPAKSSRDAAKYLDEGFTAIKLRAHHTNPEKDLEVVRAVRDTVGNDMEIMVDANQAWTLDAASTPWTFKTALSFARSLEQYDVAWLEEPLPKDDVQSLSRLCASVDVPIAGGELEQGLHRFRELIERDAYDIIQADATWSGGLLECKKVAAIAEASNKWFIPHTWSIGLGVAANLHLIGGVPNCPYMEFPCEPPAWNVNVRDMILKEPIVARNGKVKIPNKPGLGVELNEEIIRKYTVK